MLLGSFGCLIAMDVLVVVLGLLVTILVGRMSDWREWMGGFWGWWGGIHAVFLIPLLLDWLFGGGRDRRRFPLHAAARAGRTDQLRRHLTGASDLSQRDKRHGLTPLECAVTSGAADAVRLLIDAGADVNDDCGQPLYLAAAHGRAEILQILLSAGARYEAGPRRGGRTLLHVAADGAADDAAETVRHLLTLAADVNARDVKDATPLHLAADRGDLDVVHALLSAGADPSPTDARGATALHRAAEAGELGCVRRLIRADAEIDATDHDGQTALHRAAAHSRDAKVLGALIAGGADVGARDLRDRTPLHSAACNPCGPYPTVMKALLSAGARIDARDGDGRTPLLHAIWGTELWILPDTVRLLLSHGADAAATDASGRSALHALAARQGGPTCADEARTVLRLLVDHGAPVAAKDDWGRRPIDVARMTEHTAVQALLRDAHPRRPQTVA